MASYMLKSNSPKSTINISVSFIECVEISLLPEKEVFVTQEETKVMRDLVVALQLLLSSFTVTHKPARISVGTTKGWVIGAVDDGTELAIQQATDVLRQSAQYLKHVDPESKHALDELIPPKRLERPKRKPTPVRPEQTELSALFELRWVALWLEQRIKGDVTVSFVQAKHRVDSFLQRIEDRR